MNRLATIVSFAFLLAVAPNALAQDRPDHSADVRRALERLPIDPGTWEGEAWYRRGPGAPDTIHQVERIETRLDGVVLLIEGIGRAGNEVVHHAFATLGWDPAREAYRMTAWLADGSVTEAEAGFEDGVFTWGFDTPDGYRIRYRIASPSEGVWHEDGEISMDGGSTWLPFFGMTLRRTHAEGAGR